MKANPTSSSTDMNIINPHLAALIIITLLQLLSSTKCLEVEEKMRLGSMPPSCHNKCNECHPCFSVQVPTLPTHDRIKPTSAFTTSLMDLPRNRYSNYKPLGWKCRCNSHFYNP